MRRSCEGRRTRTAAQPDDERRVRNELTGNDGLAESTAAAGWATADTLVPDTVKRAAGRRPATRRPGADGSPSTNPSPCIFIPAAACAVGRRTPRTRRRDAARSCICHTCDARWREPSWKSPWPRPATPSTGIGCLGESQNIGSRPRRSQGGRRSRPEKAIPPGPERSLGTSPGGCRATPSRADAIRRRPRPTRHPPPSRRRPERRSARRARRR